VLKTENHGLSRAELARVVNWLMIIHFVLLKYKKWISEGTS
jgi:hypothetical protein